MHLLRITLAFAVLLCGACSDDVQTTYANRQEASKNGVVARGWLPNFIPASAQQIKTSNNLDLNTSHGSFSFKPADWPAFAANMKQPASITPPFANWQQTEERYKAAGYEAWSHQENDATWVFFCKPSEGKCEYFLWLHRSTGKSASEAQVQH